ncbi:MAG: hypothetical protein JW855_00825 [Gammaproteobacteria bacterium]|nr:hypothetical protein [Gammaproteobacteria bacterium]
MKDYGHLLLNKLFILNILISGLIFGGMIAWITAGPLLVIKEFHYSSFYFGIFQAMVFGSYIIGTQCVKILLKKFDAPFMIHSGLAITLGSALLAVCLTYIFPKNMVVFVITLMFYVFGSGLSFAPLNRTIVEASPKPMGVKMALASTLGTGFGALASAFTTVCYNETLLMLAIIIFTVSLISYLLHIFISFERIGL